MLGDESGSIKKLCEFFWYEKRQKVENHHRILNWQYLISEPNEPKKSISNLKKKKRKITIEFYIF